MADNSIGSSVSVPSIPLSSFVDAEMDRRQKTNPNAWVEELRPEFMERIKHYEQYLAKWGIIAQTGLEQEFLAIPATDENGHEKNTAIYGSKPFPDSPFVERIYTELHHPNSHEIVLGIGNGENKKKYPHPSLEPSVMVRVAESLNKLISNEASKKDNIYNTSAISFDPTNQGDRLYAQQIGISLWDSKTEEPLFSPIGVSELCHPCLKNLLEAQNSLVALYTVNPNSFGRFYVSKDLYRSEKNISLEMNKLDNPSILWRESGSYNKKNKYGYIENRLGHSDMPPYVNMLITLAGVAEGVREYTEKYHIKTPEELREALKIHNKVKLLKCEEYPSYKLPRTQKEALGTTENSEIAKTILGDELYIKFISGYKEHCLGGQAATRA